jgi:hypothetical protein
MTGEVLSARIVRDSPNSRATKGPHASVRSPVHDIRRGKNGSRGHRPISATPNFFVRWVPNCSSVADLVLSVGGR